MPKPSYLFCRSRELRHLAIGVVAILGLLSSTHAESINTDPVLSIGEFTISSYRVDKNYRRFAQDVNQPTSAAELSARFSRFLNQQVIIHEALKSGYGDRTEVVEEVQRMERHMLTQFEGPLYAGLYARSKTAEPDWNELYRLIQQGYNARVVRLPASAPLAADPSLFAAVRDDWSHALPRLRISGQAEVYEGVLAWPFQPFARLGDAIMEAKPGSWQQAREGDDLFFYQVLDLVSNNPPSLDSVRPELVVAWQRANKQRIQTERQTTVLHHCQFAFDWTTADRLTMELQMERQSSAELLALPLASYRLQDRPAIVTVQDYLDYEGARYVRSRLPAGPLGIFSETRKLVTAKFDWQEAVDTGVDREPQFTEDRENYRNYLALDLYEKERLRPQLGITVATIERHYREHAENYSRPTRVSGHLLRFAREADARGLIEHPERPDLATRARSAVVLTLSADSAVPGLDFLPALALASVGTKPAVGPFFLDGAYVVWTPEQVLARETPPLEAVMPAIRSQLEQPLLEQREALLARELVRGLKVQDRIDYGSYGLVPVPEKPWAP